MNRIIKFRTWDKKGKEMFNPFIEIVSTYKITEELVGSKVRIVDDLNKTLSQLNKDFILMQYTGLKDKKRTKEFPDGEEIYEGDIVRYGGKQSINLVGEVVYADTSFFVKQVDDGYESHMFMSGGMEVVGNVFENPELLEDNTRGIDK